MNRVLVFEPDKSRREALKERLLSSNLWAIAFEDMACAIELLRKQHFHACLWNIDSQHSGIEPLYELNKVRSNSAVIALSESNETSLVVKAMRAGASNFFHYSGGMDQLLETVQSTISQSCAEGASDGDIESPHPDFIGRHPHILEIFQLVYSLKNTDSTILITGESGTGKEVVARAIHGVSSRKKNPWVAVNCGAIPASLLESELFGHLKGAFTGATQNRMGRFQMAGSGTLFLDEISDLPFDLQVKLLRAIQNREFEPVGSAQSLNLEARIIAATNQELELAVAEKRFREDLYYRLNVIPIQIPPLRARKSDIPLLVHHFLERASRNCQKEFRGISEDAMRCLVDYHWPGNVRELENLMERVVVLKRDEGIIELKDFPIHHFRNVRLDRFVANVALPEDGLDFNQAVNEFENELILQALQKTEGNKNKAANLLNLNRTTLVEKLKRKGLRVSNT